MHPSLEVDPLWLMAVDNLNRSNSHLLDLHSASAVIFFYSHCTLCDDYRLYWKIKYVSRLQYLWHDIKKGQLEIPEFVQQHDDILEHRPLTDYGIEPDPMHLMEMPSTAYTYGRYDMGWTSRECSS